MDHFRYLQINMFYQQHFPKQAHLWAKKPKPKQVNLKHPQKAGQVDFLIEFGFWKSWLFFYILY